MRRPPSALSFPRWDQEGPPPYWDIFVQWEQGFLCNESLYFNFRPCGADLSSLNCILMHVITHRA